MNLVIVSIESPLDPGSPFFITACSRETAGHLEKLAEAASLKAIIRRADDPTRVASWLRESA